MANTLRRRPAAPPRPSRARRPVAPTWTPPECVEWGCNGILDHCEVGGNSDLPWVERCDTCCRYQDDLTAAEAYARKTGGTAVINPDYGPDAPLGTPYVYVREIKTDAVKVEG